MLENGSSLRLYITTPGTWSRGRHVLGPLAGVLTGALAMMGNAGRPVSPELTGRVIFRSVLVAVLALLLPASVGAQPGSTPAEQAAAIVQPAMVYVETSWAAWVKDHDGDWLNDGWPYEWTVGCSGFVVSPSGYIVTAGHCVDDSLDHGARWDAIVFGVDEWVDRGWADADAVDRLFEVAYGNWVVEGEGAGTPPERRVFVAHGRAVSGLATGAGWSARVVEVMSLSDGDVALLKVEASDLPTIQIDGGVTLAIGTPVLSVGYPASSGLVTDQSLEPAFKDGTVSSRRTRGDGVLPVYEVSAALTGGMSGGPAINHAGEVIGVNSFSVEGEPQPFNFLTPASLVSEMLTRNGVSNEPGPIDSLYRDALDAYFAGNYSEAMAGFDQVLDRVPSHQQAQDYRSQAARLRADEPLPVEDEVGAEPVEVAAAAGAADGGPPWLLIGSIGAGVFVMAGATGLLLMRRRRRRDPLAAHAAPGPPSQPPMDEAAWTPPGWHEPTVPEPTIPDTTVAPGSTAAGSTAAFCSVCGIPNLEHTRFCTNCGQSFVRPTRPAS